MLNSEEIIQKNLETKKEWIDKYRKIYQAKFRPYFDKEDGPISLKNFISSIETYIEKSFDTFGKDYSLDAYEKNLNESSVASYSQTLNEDGTINIDKLNRFLDNIEKALKATMENGRLAGDKEGERGIHFANEEGQKYFEEAFPGIEQKDGILFLREYFMGNENTKGMFNLALPYLKKYLNYYLDSGLPSPRKAYNPGSYIIRELIGRERAILNKNRREAEEQASLSNDMDKLFAGSSSELGKGTNKKQMS